MATREALEKELEIWEGVNPIITKDIKRKLQSLDVAETEKPKKKWSVVDAVKDIIEDFSDDGKLNKSNKRNKRK